MEANVRDGGGAAELGPPTSDSTSPARPEEDVAIATAPRSRRPLVNSWRPRWIRAVSFLACGVAFLSTLPLVIVDVAKHGSDDQQRVRVILACLAFFAAVVAIPISIWAVVNHAMNYTRPAMQKYIIRILWLVPIFLLNSWFALRFPSCAMYLDTLRQLYQVYVVYNFVLYLLAFFDEVPDFDKRMVMKPQIKSPPPCCCVTAVPNQRIIKRCRGGIVIYMVIRVIFTIVTIVTSLTHKLKEGDYSPHSAYLWVTVLLTTAQLWAMFCLTLLRKATREELQLLPKSTAQFLGVKMVVFLDNFQSILLFLLAHFNVIQPKSEWAFVGDKYEFARMLQDFLICLEMVFCAAFLSYAFDYKRYITGNTSTKLNLLQSFKQLWNVFDVPYNTMADEQSADTSATRPENEGQVQTTAQAPAQTTAQSQEDVQTSPRRKVGQQFTSLPDVIVHEVRSPRHPECTERDGSDHGQDGSDVCQNVTHPNHHHDGGSPNQDIVIKHDSDRSEVIQRDLKPRGDSFRYDDSDDEDDSVMGEFPSDDDDDSDTSDLPVRGARLEFPYGLKPHQRRVKKISYCGSAFDDMDMDHLTIPSRPDAVPKSPQETKRRVKKVSYAGMTFDDMDWDQIQSQRTATMDSQSVNEDSGVVEQNGTRYKTLGGGKGIEGFGTTEA